MTTHTSFGAPLRPLAVALWLIPLLSAACASHRTGAPPGVPLAGIGKESPASARAGAALPGRVDQGYGRLPLAFEENRGQTDGRVNFLSRGPGYTLYLTPTEATFVLAKSEARPKQDRIRLLTPHRPVPEPKITRTVVRMKLLGANPASRVAGGGELPGKVNYFIGNDPAKWRTDVPTYARVEYRDVYPGVSLVYYGNQRHLEYDFVVAPGADPKAVRLAFEGVEKLRLDPRGDLVLHTAAGELRQAVPVAYQTIDGTRREIPVHYALSGKNRVSFQLAAYDRTRPLVIDPVLAYSTYLTNVNASGHGVAVDGSGNAYVTGATDSPDFAIVNASQSTFGGGSRDAFVMKLNPTGSALIYSTFLGGSDSDFATRIAVDPSGHAYVTGLADSTDFPTVNALYQRGPFSGVFVAKLNPSGSTLVYSTFLGGSGNGEFAYAIAADSSGNAYVAGQTQSTDLPTVNAFQPALAGSVDAFVVKLNPAGSSVIYTTYLGGSDAEAALGLAVDSGGYAYVTGATSSTDFPIANAFQPALSGGEDAFAAKLSPVGALVYATYLGGSEGDGGTDIAVDALGSAHVIGWTRSTDFPTVNALQPTLAPFDTPCHGGPPATDVFVTKLNPAGSALSYSTYLGGSCGDDGSAIAVDAAGNAYVVGTTGSSDFPTVNPIQPSYALPEAQDVFVAALNPTGTAFLYSTFLGGSGQNTGRGIAVDASGSVYVTGEQSSDFPIVSPLPTSMPAPISGSGFVAKLAPATPSVNTSTGSDVRMPLGSGVNVTFASVSGQGQTSMTTSTIGPTPPAGFSFTAPPTYFDITTTATYAAPVKVCIRYSSDDFTDPDAVRLLHFEAGTWVDVTTSNTMINDGARQVCGEAASLSPFAVAQRQGLPLSALGPASVWVGLKNSDDVGIRFDLRAEVYRNGSELVGSGELASVPGGSSGFNNARLHALPLTPATTTFAPGDTLSIKLLVRNACTASGKNSGSARLWLNDSAANSRFDATIGDPAAYYIRDGFTLATTPGPGPRKTLDVAAGSKCSPFKAFGSWSVTLP